jgi:hypothetical protein
MFDTPFEEFYEVCKASSLILMRKYNDISFGMEFIGILKL